MKKENNILREKLARAYRIFSHYGMDDQTYTHLSVRSAGGESYFIYPLGLLFCEVTPESLIEVSLDGVIISGQEVHFNTTGYVIHSSIYKERKDIEAVFHLHTHAICAVSAMQQGLMPISQFAYHFHENMAYHHYDALALDITAQGASIVESLGEHNHMLLRNHGALTTGRTVEEAFFYMMFLENACKVQVQALGAGVDNLVIPSQPCIREARAGMTDFEQGQIGARDFDAHSRIVPFPWRLEKGSRG